MMKGITAIALAALFAMGAAAAEPDAKALATGVCSACHGPEGRSISSVFPNLAGQQSAYVLLQLDAFRSHARGDPNAQAYMWGMTSQLTDDMMKALGDYYAAQKPERIQPGANSSALVAEGEKIYMDGIKDQSVAACASCHGPKAEGQAAFPRLAGQHIDYLVAQLEGFKSALRANAPIMAGVAQHLSSEQMKAVSTYAASR
jgi:cytochrome c553